MRAFFITLGGRYMTHFFVIKPLFFRKLHIKLFPKDYFTLNSNTNNIVLTKSGKKIIINVGVSDILELVPEYIVEDSTEVRTYLYNTFRFSMNEKKSDINISKIPVKKTRILDEVVRSNEMTRVVSVPPIRRPTKLDELFSQSQNSGNKVQVRQPKTSDFSSNVHDPSYVWEKFLGMSPNDQAMFLINLTYPKIISFFLNKLKAELSPGNSDISSVVSRRYVKYVDLLESQINCAKREINV